MTQNNDIYDNLYAARIVYQSSYDNELDIIKELKIYLVESGFSLLDINQIIYEFYQHNDIQISQETINDISISSDSMIRDIINDNNDDNHINMNIINILNSLSLIINLNDNELYMQNNQHPDLQDVVVTVDNDDYEKLDSKILTLEHESKCSICMSNMVKNEKVISLNCEHIFHHECITQYLKEYNYKCPICRSEVGKPKYNI